MPDRRVAQQPVDQRAWLLWAAGQASNLGSRRPRQAGLRTLLFLLVALAVVPVFAFIVYGNFERRGRDLADAFGHTQAVTRQVARDYQSLAAGSRDFVTAVAQAPEVRGLRTTDACNRFLSELKIPGHTYTDIGVILPNGSLLCSTAPAANAVERADKPYFRDALSTRSFIVGGFDVDRVSGSRTLVFARPVIGFTGEVAGVVYATLDLSWFDRQLTDSHLPDGSAVALVDDEGTVVAQLPAQSAAFGGSIARSPLMQAMLAGQGGTAQIVGTDGVPVVAGFSTLGDAPSGGMFAVATVPESAVFGNAKFAFIRNLLLMALVTVVALAVTWWLSGYFIVRRLNALVAAANRVGQDDLAPIAGIANWRDELERLAMAFNEMAARSQALDRAYRTLSAGNHTLIHATEEQALLQDMCRAAVEVGGYRMAWVGYAENDDAKSVRPMAYAGFEDGYLTRIRITWAFDEFGAGPTGTAIRTGKPCVSQNILEDPTFSSWRSAAIERGYASMIALPLKLEDQCFGSFTIYAAEPDAFDEDEVTLLSEMADDLAFGIDVLRARAKEKESEKVVRHLAYHDPLTGLPNRIQFNERLQEEIANATRQGHALAVLVLGLNNLQEINEALGYAQGDQLLQALGSRLVRAVGESGFVGHLTRERFAVLLPRAGAEGAVLASETILKTLSTPVEIAGLMLDFSTSIGIALFPGHGTQAEMLVRQADMAMRIAQRTDAPYAMSPGNANDDSARRLHLSAELRRAIEDDKLVLHYQPKVEIRTGRVRGAETLVRWPHPTRGTIAPGEFISLAEQTGLIKPLTYWVAHAAVRQARAWSEAGVRIPLAINLSVRNLRDPQLLERIRSVLATWGTASDLLEIEITESALMEDPAYALTVLQGLHEMGIKLFVDDFGTGYSSLAYLQKLPVDAIKIDQSFVFDMIRTKGSEIIVRSTIELAHDLGLEVVAEGVENQETWDRLAEMDCDVAQGYFISRPLPADEFREWCAKRPSPRPTRPEGADGG